MIGKYAYGNIIYPLYHWVKRDGVNKRVAELERNQWLSADELAALQRKKLYRLLTFARHNVPYYRDAVSGDFPSSTSHDDLLGKLQRMPMLTKDVIRSNLARLTSEDLAGNPLEKNSTSGSTGEPLRFYTDFRSSTYRKAAAIRNNSWAGITLGDRSVNLWGSPIDASRASEFRGRLHGLLTGSRLLSAYTMTNDRMNHYISVICRFKPTLLVSYPSILETFADHCTNVGVHFTSITAVITSAETLWPHQRELFETVFGAQIFNRYGSREVGGIAHECSEHRGLHVNADRVLVEVLDKNGNLCNPGQIGEIVVTDLDNFGMPFIRYRIGDNAAWSAEKQCPCGRSMPLLSVIEGRSMDVVRAPNGNRLGGTFWTILFRAKPGIRQVQVLQEHMDGIKVRFVPDATLENSALEYFRHAIADKCGRTFRVEFEEVSCIEASITGKKQLVIVNDSIHKLPPELN